MRYSQRRAPGPGVPIAPLLPRRMFCCLAPMHLVVQARSRQYAVGLSRRIFGEHAISQPLLWAASSDGTRSPCRIRHWRPCHTSRPEDVGEPMGVARARTSDIRCAAMLALAGNQDRGTVHQPPPAGDSPFGDPNTACTERASGGTHLTPMGEGRDRVCGAIYSLIEENYALQKGQEASTSGRRGEPRRISPDPDASRRGQLLVESLLAATQARVLLLDGALSRRDMTR